MLTTAPPITPMKSPIRVKSGIKSTTGQEPGHDQVINRVRAQGGQGVDLLGDPHRAQLGGHRRADPPRQHGRRQHRAQLPDDRDVDHRPQPGGQPHHRELMIGLDRQHHADEGSRDRHHRDALDADRVEDRHQHRPPRPPANDPDQGQDRETGRRRRSRRPCRRPAPPADGPAWAGCGSRFASGLAWATAIPRRLQRAFLRPAESRQTAMAASVQRDAAIRAGKLVSNIPATFILGFPR